LCGVVGYWLLALKTIPPHSGDGKFLDKSWRSAVFRVPGYTITFPKFDLSTEYEESFEFSQVPNIGLQAGIYLCIKDPARAWWNNSSRKELKATVKFELLDSQGMVVTQLNSPVSALVWATEGEDDDHGLYLLDESFFMPDPKERYRLRVRYSPDARFGSSQGYFYIRCGGSL
jgi:hypothetical protein